MKIGIGNDHTGIELKKVISDHLISLGHEVVNYGTDSTESFDYPVAGSVVAKAVRDKKIDCGVIICGTGVGICLSANKVKGVRAAVGSDVYSATMAKEHNNCQIIALGARVVGTQYAIMIVDAWLNAEFAAGRHQKRVDMIMQLENE